MLTFDDVAEAADRTASWVHRTPVLTCASLDALAGRQLYFKCEQWQKTGAFKFRGASNAVLKLSAEQAAHGVVTHSSGNHAAALALAARRRGIPAYVVMPTSASGFKRQAVASYGATLVDCEPTLAAREAAAAGVQRRTGATFIHPYDHPDIIAGQGTAALELLAQVADLDAVVVPVGGGGLTSGTCLAVRGARRRVRVFAAEPAGADDAAQSKAANRLIPQTDPRTLADGLRTSLGGLTWPFVRDDVEAIFTATDDAIVESQRLLAERAKLWVEPSSAVALAAVLSPQFRELSDLARLGIILSGGNLAFSP